MALPKYTEPHYRIWHYFYLFVCGCVFFFLIAPLFVIFPLSFNAEEFLVFTDGMKRLDPDAFSLRWYNDMIYGTKNPWGLAARNSFIIAIFATLGSIILGTLAALGLSSRHMPYKGLIMAILISPMIVPLIISGVAIFFFMAKVGLAATHLGIILAHIILGTPFVVITVTATLSGFDHSITRAASSLGSSPYNTFMKITLPLILPGVISGGLFAFVTSFDEVVVVLFLAGLDNTTIPIQMWTGLREQLSPTILAVATCLIVLSVLILYTSGTTGIPKGIVRDVGGHIVALKWTMKNIYNIGENDVWWSASDIGWIVGHSYIVYAPLFKGCTTVLFEGKPVGTPDAGVFWRIISEYKIKSLFTAPTAFRAIKKEDPDGKFFSKYDLSSFKSLFLAGERADPDTIKWAENLLNVPVIDHWWQTETSWAISSNCTGIEMQKTKYGSACKAVPGYDVKIIKPDHSIAKPNEMGDIVVKLPLPPGTFPTLWNADKRYEENYMSNYKGYYQTYDAGHIDEDGYIWIMSRTDDIINVAGHRLSTGAIEEVLSEHQSVAECAVLGIADKLKGQLPIGLVVLKSGVEKENETISKECIKMVRDKIGPVAAFKVVIVIKRLPKTRSGKILRGTIRKIADKEDYKMPATIDDPAILKEITQSLIENKILIK